MKKILRNIYILMMATFMVAVAARAEVVEVTPSSLAEYLSTAGKTAEELKLKGHADIRDLLALQQLETLRVLDMSELVIDQYTSLKPLYLNRHSFSANVLPEYILFGSGVQKVVLPKGIVEIGEGAFATSAIEAITLPATLKNVGAYAFLDCKNLTDATFETEEVSLGDGAFRGCASLAKLDGNLASIVSIGTETFKDCISLKEIGALTGVRNLGERTFANTGVEQMKFSGIQNVGDYALAAMPVLKTSSLEADAEGLYFADTSLVKVDNTPGALPDYYFAGCSSLDIAQAVSSFAEIGDYSLAGVNIGNIILGPGLASIGAEAFSGSESLQTIYATALDGNVPTVNEQTFASLDQSSIFLYVAPEYISVWEAAEYWNRFNIRRSDFVDAVQIPAENDGITLEVNGAEAIVRSNGIIDIVEVYGADGRVIGKYSPLADIFAFGLSDAPSSILIVRVVAGERTKVFKIII